MRGPLAGPPRASRVVSVGYWVLLCFSVSCASALARIWVVSCQKVSSVLFSCLRSGWLWWMVSPKKKLVFEQAFEVLFRRHAQPLFVELGGLSGSVLAIVIALGRSESRPSIPPVLRWDWPERTGTQNDSRYGGNDCTILMTCDDKFDVAMFLLSMCNASFMPAFMCSFSFPLHFHVMSMPPVILSWACLVLPVPGLFARDSVLEERDRYPFLFLLVMSQHQVILFCSASTLGICMRGSGSFVSSLSVSVVSSE